MKKPAISDHEALNALWDAYSQLAEAQAKRKKAGRKRGKVPSRSTLWRDRKRAAKTD